MRSRESVVLTFGCARTHHPSRPATFVCVAFALAVSTMMTLTPAQAQVIKSKSCFGTWYSFDCVTRWMPYTDPYIRSVPQPGNTAERARAAAREHRWVDRCRPVLAQDPYGVPRYQYAMPGCEFGVGEY
jgi:hypothetical protein